MPDPKKFPEMPPLPPPVYRPSLGSRIGNFLFSLLTPWKR